MAELISIEEARSQLRLDEPDSNGGADDAWLALWIPVVTEAVFGWLKDEWRAFRLELGADGKPLLDSNGDPILLLDSNGDPIPQWRAKGAAVVELASMFRFREGEGKDNVVTPDAGYGYVLNKVSTNLLASLRKPTLA